MKNLSIAAALAALCLIGCGQKEDTVMVGPDGSKVTASKDGSEVKVSTPQGEMTASSKDGSYTYKDDKGNEVTAKTNVTEEELGLPFYPGSSAKDGGGIVSNENGRKSVFCTRTTSDDPEKVIAFYKDKIQEPKDTSATMGELKSATLTGKLNGAEIQVTAVKQGAEMTQISIGYQAAK